MHRKRLKAIEHKERDFEQTVLDAFLSEWKHLHVDDDAAAKRVLETLARHGYVANRSILDPTEILVTIPEDALSAKDVSLGNYKAKRIKAQHAILSKLSKDDIALVKIICCVSETLIPLKKLAPGVCNIKSTGKGFDASVGTPFYNSVVLQDMLRPSHEIRLAEAAKQCPKFIDALTLVREWVHRNQPAETIGPVPMLILGLVMADWVLSADGGHLWSKSNSHQLFRKALQWLAEIDWSALHQGCKRIGGAQFVIDAFSDAAFFNNFSLVVIDPSGSFNLAYNVLPCSYSLLRNQARAALKTDDEEALLLLKVDSLSRFDLLMRIHIPRPPVDPQSGYTAAEEVLASNQGFWEHYVCGQLNNLLQRGLVLPGRVKSMGMIYLNENVVLGLCVDPEKAFRLVDRGPPAEDEVAAGQFRALWGSKSELRRFKDGAIIEAVVWDDSKRRQIPVRIVSHLLETHPPFNREPQDVDIFGSSFETMDAQSEAGEDENSRKALKLVQQLEQTVKQMKDLALPVADVGITTSPALRYTGFVPKAHPMAFGSKDNVRPRSSSNPSRYVPITAFVQIRFEGSSKWPDDAQAKRALECALLVELARSLETTGISSEDESMHPTCIVSTQGYVDVLVRGYAIRVSPQRRDISSDSQRLQMLLHTLHHRAETGASSSFGLVARSVRRWISGQRFSSILGEDMIDLLVASLFTQPFPVDPPRGSLSGLMRFLDFLGMFDWARRPLLIDLVSFSPCSKEVHERADKAFFSQRGNGSAPSMVIYLKLRPEDDEKAFFTPFVDGQTQLTEESLHKMILRARETKQYLIRLCELSAQGPTQPDARLWRAVFASDPSAGFDIVLELDKDACKMTTNEKLASQYQNLTSIASRQSVVGLNPVEHLVQELRASFHHFAEFFVGSNIVPTVKGASSTTSIGVVWKLAAKSPVTFKLGTAKLRQPSEDDPNRMELNIDEVLDEMARVGRGLISNIIRCS